LRCTIQGNNMQPITLIVENEAAYLHLIADCFEHGAHEPNPFVKSRIDELALSDVFVRLSEDALYNYLGCYTTDVPPGTLVCEKNNYESYQEASITAKEYEVRKLVRKNMKLHYECTQVLVPKAEDYPIVIHWHWLDGWDRSGKIKERHFMWHSLSNITRINNKDNPIKSRHMQWESQFGALYDKLSNTTATQST